MVREIEIKQPFNLKLSLTMGQAFRWQPLENEWFSGVLGQTLFHVKQTDGGVEYCVGDVNGERVAGDSDDWFLRRYFREDTDDVAAIYNSLSRDSRLAEMVKQHGGLRLLRQDPWECTVAYLCSANNNIPRIANIMERIAAEFGDDVELKGQVRSVFPPPERLAQMDAEQTLHGMRLGLNRAANIVAVARSVSTGALDLYALRNEPYVLVKKQIRSCRGVGDKIADCIALFSLDKMEAFPVDVHIGRALAGWIDCPFPQSARSPSGAQYAAVVSWAQDKFGPYAGYAGQLMFCDQPK